MEKLTASYISKLCGGVLYGDDVQINSIVRDNREISGGELFVAIRGEKFDGHSFVQDAANRGASAVLVSEKNDVCDAARIVVEDTVRALGDIASGYLKTLELLRVCITGSVGKTTTKEMCAAVLAEKYKTHKTQGNFNNNIGLPLTVFGLDKSHEAAVFEIGTNHFGEILPLARIAAPHIALITTIGESHLEAFGTKEGVLREKTEIFNGLVDGGVAVLNGDDPLLWGLRDSLKHKVLWFGLQNEECDVFGEIISANAYEAVFEVRGSDVTFRLSCGGEHNVRDALSAIAVGRAAEMTDEEIARGLSRFENTGMRQDIYSHNGITVIRDCYNANPDSMRASLAFLRDFETDGTRFAVLGDMRELGGNAEALHVDTGRFAGECADCVLTTGEFSSAYMRGSEKVLVFEDKIELSEYLRLNAKNGDVVLVKGSYGTKMWEVLELMKWERK
ncbi:MAG: UDP-N-acetylmuramoyl-tripeptide--D-alanyl-D-alanine ligase [Oscillospiraceae bacterium]|nr:UDP-N-acetylmuramoyl-tripeptide--D-alanyl-D-alanine ligase [Oscillospiraceae bacterium]